MTKRALVIGGSSGIGWATVQKLSENDFDVCLIHRDRRQQATTLHEKINALGLRPGQVTPYNIDATNTEKIRTCVDTMTQVSDRPFDMVVHALSRGNLKRFVSEQGPQLQPSDLQLTISSMGTNLHDWVDSLLAQDMLGSGSRIIGLTSEGNNRYWEGYGAVALAKSALESLCQYLAIELAPKGIRVNIIQAGVTDTPSLRLIPESDALIQKSTARNPMGRLTTPKDVADMIYLLSLPEAGWVNGSLIHVDGGEHLI